MSMDEDISQNWLLGGALAVLLGGGLIVAVLLSIVLAPLAPYFAFGPRGGVCGSVSTGRTTGATQSSIGYRSAVSPVRSLAARVSTASLSLRESVIHLGASGRSLLRRRAWIAI